MSKKEELIDEFVKDSLVYIIQITEKELNKKVEPNYSSREAVFEQINNLLMELPERSISLLPTCLSIGFELLKEFYPTKGEATCGII